MQWTADVGGHDVEMSAGGYLEGLGIVDTGGGPYQPPQATGAVRIDGTVQRWHAHMEMRAMAGGPFRNGEVNVFDLRHAFQDVSPSLDFSEAYLAWRGERVELRAGIQRFAFGKLDGVPPTDVVNPRDFHDPLVRDFEEAKIGVPALAASYFPSDWTAVALSHMRVDLAYVPLAVPPRLPLPRERWFPPTTNLSEIPIACALIPQDLGIPCDDNAPPTIQFDLETENDAPPVAFSASGIVLRAAGTWAGVDWDVYHYTGPETAPNASLSAQLALDLTARATLRQEHTTMHMTGFDVAATFGGATIRAESAFLQNRHYLRRADDLVTDITDNQQAIASIVAQLKDHGSATVPLGDLFVGANSVEWGVGVDYFIAGFLPLLQLNQTIVLDNTPRLLIGDPDTRVTGVVRRSFWQDRFELDLRSAYTFETGSWLVLPRLAYAVTDSLRVRLGYLALGGSRNSLIGQYKRNDEVILDARFSF
jgi:hypothetical protein